MASTIRVRATSSGDTTEVQALIQHPMDFGFVKNSAGELIPPHFIQQLTFEYDGKPVFIADWGPAVSKDPYVKFSFKGGKKGDDLKISWLDNKGASDSIHGKNSIMAARGRRRTDMRLTFRSAAAGFVMALTFAAAQMSHAADTPEPIGRSQGVSEIFHRQVSQGEAGGLRQRAVLDGRRTLPGSGRRRRSFLLTNSRSTPARSCSTNHSKMARPSRTVSRTRASAFVRTTPPSTRSRARSSRSSSR